MVSLIGLLVGLVFRAPAPADRPGWAIRLDLERRVEHVGYHFTDPSTFDTSTPVPHVFDQHYDTSNTWIAVAISYHRARLTAWTDVAVAPRRTTAGSDLDTFFDPSGDVIVSGTDGLVSLGSLVIAERLGLVQWHGWTLGPMVAYRRSAAAFPPDFVLVTHSNPPSVSRSFTTDRETTLSQIVESGVTGQARWSLAGDWRVHASVELLPLTLGRLVVSLPDNAPPVTTSWRALSFGARGQLAIEHDWGPLDAGLGLTGGGAWSYEQTSAYRMRGFGVTVYVRAGG